MKHIANARHIAGQKGIALMVVTIQEFLELKKILQDKYHTNIHYHESCDSQHFSADAPLSGPAKIFIRDYFSKWYQKVKFYDDDKLFVLVDISDRYL